MQYCETEAPIQSISVARRWRPIGVNLSSSSRSIQLKLAKVKDKFDDKRDLDIEDLLRQV